MIRTLSYKEALAVDFVLSYALLTMKNLLTVGNSFVFEHNFEFNTLLLLFTFCLYGITFFIYRKFTLNLTSCAWLAVIGLFWLGSIFRRQNKYLMRLMRLPLIGTCGDCRFSRKPITGL